MPQRAGSDLHGIQELIPGFFSGHPIWICDSSGKILESRNASKFSFPDNLFFELVEENLSRIAAIDSNKTIHLVSGQKELTNEFEGVFSCRKLWFRSQGLLIFRMKEEEKDLRDTQSEMMAEEFGIYPWRYYPENRGFWLGKGASEKLLGIFGSRVEYEDFFSALAPESLSRFTAAMENALNFGREFKIEVLLETGKEYRWISISGRTDTSQSEVSISGFLKDLSAEKAEKVKSEQLESWIHAGMNRMLVKSSSGEILADLGSSVGKHILEEGPGHRKARIVDFRNEIKFVVEAETGNQAAAVFHNVPSTLETEAEKTFPEFETGKLLSKDEKFISLTRALGLRTDAQVSALGVFDGSRFEWKAWWKSPSGYAVPSNKYAGEWLPELSWLVEMEAENMKFSDRYWWPQDMLPFEISDSFGKGWMLLTERISPTETGLVALRSKKPEEIMGFKEEVLQLLGLLLDKPGNSMPDDSIEKLKTEIVRREMLLKELNHRAKNNLALAAGMIKMQASYSEDKNTRQFLKQTQKRLETLATLHELMYLSPGTDGNVEIQTYLSELVTGLQSSFGNPEISLEIKVDSASINMRFANTIGLLVNEIVSNSFKHAFLPGKPGLLKVDFLSKGDYFKLRISDNGPGFEPEAKAENTSLGNILIDEFVKQLNAEMEVNRNPGTTYLISIKKSNIGL